MDSGKIIGVIGGMGPHAGLDLVAKIFNETIARTDQEHLPVALLSFPERIPDRSTFLFDESQPSPVPALLEMARQLDRLGAVVAGIPCNTAHEPRIFDVLTRDLAAGGHSMRLLHMIEETARFIRERYPNVQRAGVLSSSAVYRFRLYKNTLEAAGLEAVRPDEAMQEQVVDPVIFDPGFGIKAQNNPVAAQARQNLLDATADLKERGAQVVILGCTEFPLAVPEPEVHGLPVIDPTVVLARTLIGETAPAKLRSLQHANTASS